MEPFVFAGNRRRWKYLRPLVGAAAVGAALWFAALCWLLLTAPALPSLELGNTRSTFLARAGAPLPGTRGMRVGTGHSPRWALR
jgi:hypothetical protein